MVICALFYLQQWLRLNLCGYAAQCCTLYHARIEHINQRDVCGCHHMQELGHFCIRIRSGLDKSCICGRNTFIFFMHM
jgi:hypothetical protein